MGLEVSDGSQTTFLKTVSLVVPIYNESDVLDELSRRINQVIDTLPGYRWEVIYVNDGSTDGSTEKIAALTVQYPWLSGIHLSRNFGHQIAISAGVEFASGDAVVLMDGDLQDPPELIAEMIQRWEEGYDVVYATRREREGEPILKRMTARLYYRFLQQLADISIPLDTGDFRLMSRPVADALRRMPEHNRFIRGMVSWVGYRQTPVYYQRDSRYGGKTKFTFLQMRRFAMDGLLSFSKVPLQWITSLGFAISTLSLIGMGAVFYIRVFTDIYVERGWSSIMLGILMLGGIQLICLGTIGEYLGRIFDEVRGRPLYLVRGVDGQLSVSHSARNAEVFEKSR